VIADNAVVDCRDYDSKAASPSAHYGGTIRLLQPLCVPRTSSMSCDQAIFVDHATDASLSSYAVPVEIDRSGRDFSGAAASRER
jgi:hypothetical protein